MYVYIVTRIVSRHPADDGITDVPNLGVHRSRESANGHFDSLVQDRLTAPGAELLWSFQQTKDELKSGFDRALRRSMVKYTAIETEIHEEIRIERWPL